jgi:hypothetical protein
LGGLGKARRRMNLLALIRTLQVLGVALTGFVLGLALAENSTEFGDRPAWRVVISSIVCMILLLYALFRHFWKANA